MGTFKDFSIIAQYRRKWSGNRIVSLSSEMSSTRLRHGMASLGDGTAAKDRETNEEPRVVGMR